MKKQELEKIIKNGGASLDPELKIMDLKSGYSVSILGAETVYNLDSINYDEVIRDLEAKNKKIQNKKGYYVGVWIDDDKLYTDISKTITNYSEAVKFGVANKQKAIFNNKTGKVIELVKNYYIIYNYNKDKDDLKYQIEFEDLKEAVQYLKDQFNIKDVYHHITEALNNLKVINDIVIFKDKEYLYNIEA